MDVKGGCSPQNIFETVDLVTELAPGGKQIRNDLTRRKGGNAISCFDEIGAAVSDELPL